MMSSIPQRANGSLAPAAPVTIIEPSQGWVQLRLRELWDYKELLYFLVWREVKVRYKQTAIGAAWAILQPLLSMLIFSIFFGRLAKIPSDGVPYPLFSLAGLAPWTFFSNGLSQSALSLVTSSNLVKKVYFPRLIIPISSVLSGFVDLGLTLCLVLLFGLYHGVFPTANIVWLPAFAMLAFMTALGVGLWLSALNAQYRDIRYVVPFLTQFWMFATPIVYPSSLLNEPWKTLYALNPMVGVVEGFRWSLLNTGNSPGPMVAVSATVAIIVLISGAYYFRAMERTFADVV
ncbi:MAG: ABC transporter permease [Bryobacteraceae bacterium]|nr:ABC transporter permease [Bryobacteraceae bacterium]